MPSWSMQLSVLQAVQAEFFDVLFDFIVTSFAGFLTIASID